MLFSACSLRLLWTLVLHDTKVNDIKIVRINLMTMFCIRDMCRYLVQLYNSINFLALLYCIRLLTKLKIWVSVILSFQLSLVHCKSWQVYVWNTPVIWLHVQCTCFFQDQKTCLEKENSEKKTPLHMASENGHVE